MTKETALGLSDLLQAFANGKTIQMNTLHGWKDINPIIIEELVQAVILFPDTKCLRIKPEKKLVPFTLEDNLLFRDKWIKCEKDNFKRSMRIIKYEGDCVSISNKSFGCTIFLDDYIFEDGSPCGKYVEE